MNLGVQIIYSNIIRILILMNILENLFRKCARNDY